DRVGRAEQVLEEVLVALAGRAEQVRPPDGQHPRVVLGRVRVLGREPQPSRGQLPGHERAWVLPERSAASARSSGFQLNVGKDGIHPSRADWASRSAVAIPANRPSPAGEANVAAPNVSYRHWSVARYQYAVPIICRGGRTQSRDIASAACPVTGRTF